MDEQNNETSTEWALSHLNCEEYKKAYDAYSKILICQNNFNSKIEKFLSDNEEHMKQITGSNDDNEIKELSRFYLATLVAFTQPKTDTEYKIKHLSNELNTFNETLHNPFPENLPQLRTNMELNRCGIIRSLEVLKNDVNKLNNLISDFQKSLKPVIDNSVSGLKGNCPIDNQLKYWFLIKSFFHRRLHSVLKSTTCSHLQSLFRISH